MSTTTFQGETNRSVSAMDPISDPGKTTAPCRETGKTQLIGNLGCESLSPLTEQNADIGAERIWLLPQCHSETVVSPSAHASHDSPEFRRNSSAVLSDGGKGECSESIPTCRGTTDELSPSALDQPVMSADKRLDSDDVDGELLQRVKRFLCQRGCLQHRTVEISVERGVVVVQGRVPTYYLRQVTVECAKRVAGVTRVIDLIKVGGSSIQRLATVGPVEESADSTESARHGEDAPDMALTAKHATQSDV